MLRRSVALAVYALTSAATLVGTYFTNAACSSPPQKPIEDPPTFDKLQKIICETVSTDAADRMQDYMRTTCIGAGPTAAPKNVFAVCDTEGAINCRTSMDMGLPPPRGDCPCISCAVVQEPTRLCEASIKFGATAALNFSAGWKNVLGAEYKITGKYRFTATNNSYGSKAEIGARNPPKIPAGKTSYDHDDGPVATGFYILNLETKTVLVYDVNAEINAVVVNILNNTGAEIDCKSYVKDSRWAKMTPSSLDEMKKCSIAQQ